jgi:hypothetical protein
VESKVRTKVAKVSQPKTSIAVPILQLSMDKNSETECKGASSKENLLREETAADR